MRKSFTLIEVLIATMIIFIVVGVMIDVSSNSKKLFYLTKRAEDFNLKSSVAIIEQKEVKNLYEQLIDFNITDDEIIENLKKEEISLEIEEDLRKDFNISENKNISVIIKKIKAYNKEFSNTAYEIEVQ
ncbi:MAG: hypothetical protein ABGX25_06650 [Nautiliaceae bacterium]